MLPQALRLHAMFQSAQHVSPSQRRTDEHLEPFSKAVQDLGPAFLGILLLVHACIAHLSKLWEAGPQLCQKPQGQYRSCAAIKLSK